MTKVYLASSLNKEHRYNAECARDIMVNAGLDVYYPLDHVVPHAWDYPNYEWGLMVFTNDVTAIKDADFVVMLSYGRNSTAGANWEAGYAYGIGKPVILVEMTDEIESLMVANGRYATVKGLEGLESYISNTEKLAFLKLYPAREGNNEQK